MLTNQQTKAMKYPITTAVNAIEFAHNRHPRPFWRSGKEYTATLSVNVGTGDCKPFTPEAHAVWHVTVSLSTQVAMKPAKDWSDKERTNAESVALAALDGAGDSERGTGQYDTICYHYRRPLTPSELRMLPDDLKAGLEEA